MTRIKYIDIARGLGILLVVIGHSNIPNFVDKFVYLFHMPLFFFISGYLVKDNVVDKKKEIFNKIKKLVIPYLSLTIFNLLLFNLFTSKYIFSEILFFGWRGIALWFVITLFFISIISVFINWRNINNLIITTFLTIFLIFYFQYSSIKLPYKLEIIPICFFWFTTGAYLKIHTVFEQNIPKKLFFIFCFLLLTFLISFVNPFTIDLANNFFGYYHFAFLGGLLGVSFVFSFSQYIENKLPRLKNVLTYLGTNSLVILAFHQVYNLLLSYLFLRFNLKGSFAFIFKYVFLFILLGGTIVIFNRYFYFLIGKEKKN